MKRSDEPTIIFRQVDDPLGSLQSPQIRHWQVEAHADVPWPVGVAFVSEQRACDEGDLPTVVLDYIFVIDDRRRRGIGTRLVQAVQKRWPGNLHGCGNGCGRGAAEAYEPQVEEVMTCIDTCLVSKANLLLSTRA